MRKLRAVTMVLGGLFLFGCGLWEEVPVPPAEAPCGLSASFGAARESISLAWQPVERAKTYQILRRDPGSAQYQLIGTASSESYADRPPAPSFLSASDGDHPDKIVVEWEEIPGASEYQVFGDPISDCSGLCYLDSVGTHRYEDEKVRPGLRYRYAVRAGDDWGYSNLSPEDTGCVSPCPLPFSFDEERP